MLKKSDDIQTIILEYIWIDGKMKLRSKYKTIKVLEKDLNIEQWKCDGKLTYHIYNEDGEIILNPISFYSNPFFDKDKSYLVLCDTFYDNQSKITPTLTNYRMLARDIFQKKKELDPWFVIKQDYYMMCNEYTYTSSTPLFFKNPKLPKEEGDYYCGVGNDNIIMRNLAEKHYIYCINAGINISGMNAEAAPNQWKFKIGPSPGIEAADDLIVARYILLKLSESANVDISFVSKPLPKPWNTSKLCINLSTIETRENDGITKLNSYMNYLKNKHNEHMLVYSDPELINNESNIDNLNIHIPNKVKVEKKGYLVDNRPISNSDPYLTISKIYDTCCISIN